MELMHHNTLLMLQWIILLWQVSICHLLKALMWKTLLVTVTYWRVEIQYCVRITNNCMQLLLIHVVGKGKKLNLYLILEHLVLSENCYLKLAEYASASEWKKRIFFPLSIWEIKWKRYQDLVHMWEKRRKKRERSAYKFDIKPTV